MGIFSFLKRKNEPADNVLSIDTRLRVGEPSRLSLDNEAERARQREIARATAAKIDAIELEMTSDIFNEPEPAWGSTPRRAAGGAGTAPDTTLPMLELTTTALLADDAVDDLPDAAAAPASAPVVEESAILYANGQLDAAEQMLLASLPDAGRSERAPWWMLFDLYQASGREHDFESIAIDYASHFETSPPAWAPLAQSAVTDPGFAGVTPTEALDGVLDDSVAPQLERLLQAGAAGPVRLELGRVRALAPAGCARLLAALQALRGDGRVLVVAGADMLAALLRPALVVGQRDSGATSWLLLLELLQLLNREKEFEETAMDYCVTFEVSPPSFEPPQHVAAVPAEAAPNLGASGAGERFLLPALVEGDCAALLAAIDAYAARNDPVLLDCARLARIDYNAAGLLLQRLRALAATGRALELRELNHPVAALLRLLGAADCARLYPHKY